MADLTITAASVAYTGSDVRRGTAGATITAGQSVYYDTSAATWKLADASATTTVPSGNVGIALHGAASTQPITVIVNKGSTPQDINLGATLVKGTVYVVSATAGGIAPLADLLSGEFICVLGIASSTSNLKLLINNTGVAV